MKVVDERMETKKSFSSIEVGVTFLYDHELYMKIGTMKSPTGYLVNAIKLGLGSDERFGDSELVIPVKCELHIVD